ncbi:MAG: HD domain-containing protein [Clostridia bacterium]|nr:HD domain-containing protein [Clostridia bacterium]
MNFKPIKEGSDKVDGFALVKQAEVKTSSKGGKYLDIDLADKDGEINGKYWDYTDGEYNPGDLVKVRGTISEYNGRPQMRIELIRLATFQDNVNVADYVKSADYKPEDMFAKICEIICRFSDEDLKKICLKVYEDNKEKLLYYPAALRLHHAMLGGLLFHTLSIMTTALKVCEVYPQIDKDLLVAGAALHDIGKLEEIESSTLGVASEYSVDGNLIGHLVRGAFIVRKTGEELGIDEEKIRLLEHMLLSHHGNPEYGAAVRPMFLEASVLNMLDDLDAKIYEISEFASEVEPGTLTQRQWALDNVRIYNHGRKEIKPQANLIEE